MTGALIALACVLPFVTEVVVYRYRPQWLARAAWLPIDVDLPATTLGPAWEERAVAEGFVVTGSGPLVLLSVPHGGYRPYVLVVLRPVGLPEEQTMPASCLPSRLTMSVVFLAWVVGVAAAAVFDPAALPHSLIIAAVSAAALLALVFGGRSHATWILDTIASRRAA